MRRAVRWVIRAFPGLLLPPHPLEPWPQPLQEAQRWRRVKCQRGPEMRTDRMEGEGGFTVPAITSRTGMTSPLQTVYMQNKII